MELGAVHPIGRECSCGQKRLYVWATRLKDGAPAVGAEVELYPHGTTATVEPNGLAALPLPETGERGQLVLVRDGKDLSLLPGF